MWKSLITNWTTSIPALLATACGAAELIGLFPDAWEKYVVALCTFMLATGLFAAKSAGVTNSKDPGGAVVVSKTAAETTNPAVAAGKALGIMFLIVLFSTVLTACESLKPIFSDTQNQLEAIIAVTAAGVYDVNYVVKRNGLTMLAGTIVYECTQADGKLTGCHKRNPAPAAVVP